MLRNFRTLAHDEAGFIISAELVLVLTIAVLGMVVGLAAVRDAVTNELNDLAHAFGAVSQSYSVVGLTKPRGHGYHGNYGDSHASINGFGFNDNADECDCKKIRYVDVCGKDDPSYGNNE